MRLLDRQILRELFGPFLFGVAAFTSIMFAGKDFFNITELLAEYHAPLSEIGRLVVLSLPSIVVLTLPMSMLLAALIGFGRLSGDSEIVALYAGGIGFYRIVVPVVFMGVLVSVGSYILNEMVVPSTFAAHERILKTLKNQPLASDKPFSLVDSSGKTNRFIYVQGGMDASTNTLRKVSVVQFDSEGPSLFIYGSKAVWDREAKWRFQDGYTQSLGDRFSVNVRFPDLAVNISKSPKELALYQKKAEEMNFGELSDHIASLHSQHEDVRELSVRLYQKIALPLASLVFALIGAPLGLRPQRGSSAMGLGLSIVIIFGYWVLTHYMTILGDNGALSPAAASFVPTLAGAATGLALISRASR